MSSVPKYFFTGIVVNGSIWECREKKHCKAQALPLLARADGGSHKTSGGNCLQQNLTSCAACWFSSSRAQICFVQWLCLSFLRRLQQEAVTALMKLRVTLPQSQCQCFPNDFGLLFQWSSLPPSWQMVQSYAAATAESNLWKCDSTVKIFQHCCSEKLQWWEVTV